MKKTERIAELEEKVAALEAEVAALRVEVGVLIARSIRPTPGCPGYPAPTIPEPYRTPWPLPTIWCQTSSDSTAPAALSDA
jgi:hypothetical protein